MISLAVIGEGKGSPMARDHASEGIAWAAMGEKTQGKRQKAKSKRQKCRDRSVLSDLLPFALCLLPFALCFLLIPSPDPRGSCLSLGSPDAKIPATPKRDRKPCESPLLRLPHLPRRRKAPSAESTPTLRRRRAPTQDTAARGT